MYTHRRTRTYKNTRRSAKPEAAPAHTSICRARPARMRYYTIYTVIIGVGIIIVYTVLRVSRRTYAGALVRGMVLRVTRAVRARNWDGRHYRKGSERDSRPIIIVLIRKHNVHETFITRVFHRVLIQYQTRGVRT